ncbi:hypothetical protein G7092_21180 [Mucilaginibacter sp. HC2]|uniref:glycosyl hydrolase family 28-related protein n=1 Tax=Mucilaginibacter inviolabilis TaxID=2714892 RepID=UPI00140D6654|nr:glycosyl hydrolase family 28-related protein [Mucilaginibacter inviolabilis]NHA06336.1 hypothetical protein [Mucilaginibacter inviolabilis]
MATVSNFQALATFSYTTGNEFVYIQGHDVIGDGGQGFFYWDNTTGANNGGTMIPGPSGCWKRVYDGFLNAKWFGAKGDGITDDRVALTNAINAAVVLGRTLFIPKGTYYVPTVQPGQTTSLIVTGNNLLNGLEITGEPGTKITSDFTGQGTPDTGYTLIRFVAGFKGLKICNIAFESTHGITQTFTNGLTIMPGKGIQNSNMQIINCSFTGFSTAILVNGTNQLLISKCSFYSPRGHDDARHDNTVYPAVYINFTSNENGININPTVTGCYADGYSATTPVAPPIALDGFIIGDPSGITVASNTIRNFSQESIFITPNLYCDALNPQTYPTIIRDNVIQYDLSIDFGRYGIRCDAVNADISNNVIINTIYGIFCYGTLYSKTCVVNTVPSNFPVKFTNWRIANNNISLAQKGIPPDSKGQNFLAQRAIYVQGNTSNSLKASNIDISGNHITLSNVAISQSINLITLADIEYSVVNRNNIHITGTTGLDATHTLNIYALLNNNDNIVLSTGDIVGTYSSLYTGTGVNSNMIYLDHFPVKENILFKSAAYNVLSADFASGKQAALLIYVDATVAGFAITLPIAPDFAGFRVTVVKVNVGNMVTVNNITGPNTLTAQGQSLTFAYNTTTSTWWPD